ncbi:MAG: hypothetical protein WCP85_17750 [Mariniphaga sp.]
MKSKQLNLNLFIIFATLLLFAIGYYIYLEVYTNSREAHIVRTKSRILEQMSKDLNLKVQSMETNSKEYVKHLMDLSRNRKNSTMDDILMMLEDKKDLSYFNTDLEFVKSEIRPTGKKILTDLVTNVKSEAKQDFLYFNLNLANKAKTGRNMAIEFKAQYNSLMLGFVQREIFSQYILVIDNNVVFTTLPGKPVLTFNNAEKVQASGSEISSTNENLIGIISLSTASKSGLATINGVTSYEINISSNQYKVFVCQVQVEDKTWYVCGLVEKEKINQAKRAMAPWIVIFMLMILGMIIFGLPFIKLKVMSPTEQLSSSTLINFGISLYLICGFTFWFILFVSNAFWYDRQNETRLKDLSTEINNSLNTEIKSVYNQLCYYDSIAYKSGMPLPSSANILLANPYKPTCYPYFDYSFWMDSTGYQTGILSPFSVKEKATKLANRDYFKTPDEWQLPKDESHRFRMESIVSVTSGVSKVALSKKSELNNTVIAITGRFYSIIEPLLPQAYKFCIIDGNGLVWFHSDKQRNMQENLISECNQDKAILAAIFSNSVKTLDVNYYDDPYRIRIVPLTPIPLYLVTMFDKKREYGYQIQSLVSTLLFASSLTTFLIGFILIFIFCKRLFQKSTLKNQLLEFFSVREKYNKVYLLLSVWLFLIALFYLMVVSPINLMNPLLFGIDMVLFVIPYSIYAINGFSLKSRSRNLFALISLILLIILNYRALVIVNHSDFNRLLLFESFIIALSMTCFYMLKRGYTLNYKPYTVTFYLLYLSGLLFAFSVVPSIKIFEASVNHELIRGIKHDQLALVRQYDKRNLQLRYYYKLMEHNHKLVLSVGQIYEERVALGIYSQFIGTTFTRFIRPQNIPKSDSKLDNSEKFIANFNDNFEGIVNFFRPLYDDISVETKYLEGESFQNSNQVWHQKNDSIVFNYLSPSFADSGMNNTYKVNSIFHRPNIFNPFVSENEINQLAIFQRFDVLFMLLLFGIFYCIYLLVRFGIRRMLGISILEMHTEYNFGDRICTQINSGQSIMVIGSPFENKFGLVRNLVDQKFEINRKDVVSQELKSDRDALPGKRELLLMENFAGNYYLSSDWILQMEFICDKIQLKEQILIYSTISPYKILDYLEGKASSTGSENASVKSDTSSITWEQLLLQFKTILSQVNVLFVPQNYDGPISEKGIQPIHSGNNNTTDFINNQKESLQDFIRNELEASTYLIGFSREVGEFYEYLVTMELPYTILKNRISQKILELGSLYYESILDSCTPMELFVMSDMAQDMVINIKNKRIVNLLIQKGIFVVDGCNISFMNESFRKHVLQKFTPEEKLRLKAKLGDTGASWQGYKLFLVLFMVGLLSFLFIANRSILDNLNKLFIVLGGGTVLITNLTGLLTKKDIANPK